MYNYTRSCWLENTNTVVAEGKVLCSKTAKSEMFGIGMVRDKNYLTHSAQFVFLILRFVLETLFILPCMEGKFSREHFL